MAYTLTKEAIQDILNGLGLNVQSITGFDPSERTYRKLFWRDDMENYTILKWVSDQATTTVSYVNNEIAAFEGDYVLKFVDSTNLYAECRTRLFGQLPLQINSLEVRWWKPTNFKQMEFLFAVQSLPTIRYIGAIRWNIDENKWQYCDNVNIWRNIEGTDETIRNDTWNYLKILVDFQNLRLYRLISNALDVDLSDLNIPIQSLSYVTDKCSYIFLRSRNTIANNPCYIDDVRIYLNEV